MYGTHFDSVAPLNIRKRSHPEAATIDEVKVIRKFNLQRRECISVEKMAFLVELFKGMKPLHSRKELYHHIGPDIENDCPSFNWLRNLNDHSFERIYALIIKLKPFLPETIDSLEEKVERMKRAGIHFSKAWDAKEIERRRIAESVQHVRQLADNYPSLALSDSDLEILTKELENANDLLTEPPQIPPLKWLVTKKAQFFRKPEEFASYIGQIRETLEQFPLFNYTLSSKHEAWLNHLTLLDILPSRSDWQRFNEPQGIQAKNLSILPSFNDTNPIQFWTELARKEYPVVIHVATLLHPGSFYPTRNKILQYGEDVRVEHLRKRGRMHVCLVSIPAEKLVVEIPIFRCFSSSTPSLENYDAISELLMTLPKTSNFFFHCGHFSYEQRFINLPAIMFAFWLNEQLHSHLLQGYFYNAKQEYNVSATNIARLISESRLMLSEKFVNRVTISDDTANLMALFLERKTDQYKNSLALEEFGRNLPNFDEPDFDRIARYLAYNPKCWLPQHLVRSLKLDLLIHTNEQKDWLTHIKTNFGDDKTGFEEVLEEIKKLAGNSAFSAGIDEFILQTIVQDEFITEDAIL